MPEDHEQRTTVDAAMAALGLEVHDVAPGRAVVSLLVRTQHGHGRGVASPGVAFTVADAAIALASNAYGPPALLVHADVQWLGPAAVGGRLTATCRAVHRDPTTASFESRLTTGDDVLVGVVWGTTRSPRT